MCSAVWASNVKVEWRGHHGGGHHWRGNGR
jgi:hypothetical protein